MQDLDLKYKVSLQHVICLSIFNTITMNRKPDKSLIVNIISNIKFLSSLQKLNILKHFEQSSRKYTHCKQVTLVKESGTGQASGSYQVSLQHFTLSQIALIIELLPCEHSFNLSPSIKFIFGNITRELYQTTSQTFYIYQLNMSFIFLINCLIKMYLSFNIQHNIYLFLSQHLFHRLELFKNCQIV